MCVLWYSEENLLSNLIIALFNPNPSIELIDDEELRLYSVYNFKGTNH